MFKKKCFEREKKKKIGYIKLKLIDVATAPTHFNLKLKAFSNVGRLIFNVKMTQIIKVEVLVNELAAKFEKPLNGQLYMFNFIYLVF